MDKYDRYLLVKAVMLAWIAALIIACGLVVCDLKPANADDYGSYRYLYDMDDTDFTFLLDNYVLQWDAGAGMWTSGPGLTLAGNIVMEDFDITGVGEIVGTSGQDLTFESATGVFNFGNATSQNMFIMNQASFLGAGDVMDGLLIENDIYQFVGGVINLEAIAPEGTIGPIFVGRNPYNGESHFVLCSASIAPVFGGQLLIGDGDGNYFFTVQPNGDTYSAGEINSETLIVGDGGTTDYTEGESDGTVVFHGAATVWEDLRVAAQNAKINPNNSEPAFEDFTDGLFAYQFDTANADDESVHFVAQMPCGYKEGSDIYPHIHWSPDSTDTGNVRWEFEYVVANIDGTFAGSATSETITEAADGTAKKHQVADFSAISGSGLTISHIFICRLTRMSATDAADTFTGNAVFLEFDFRYEIDTVGSRTATAK